MDSLNESRYSFGATLAIYSLKLCNSINNAILNKGEFTTVTETPPSEILPSALALMCLGEDTINGEIAVITHIGIIKKGQRVSTGQSRIKVTNIIEVEPTPLSQIVSKMKKKIQSHAFKAVGIGYSKISEQTGKDIFNAVIETFPDQEEIIKKLARKHLPVAITKSLRSETSAVEKDAVSICLDIFGIDRSKVLNSWEPKEDGSIGESFLNGLTNYRAYEDDLINHDLRSLPGWNFISEQIKGVAEFKNAKGEKLVIINANRKPLEKAMGVDLIYFHRHFDAFTFVQYKMMDQKCDDDNKAYYNPNQSSHDDEIRRMQELYDLIKKEKSNDNLKDFRFSDCPIFFKICKKLMLKTDDTSIAVGAYIPITQWHMLLNDESTLGPKGGRQIGFHTLGGRYVGTQVFIELMQKGLLGTQLNASQKIALFVEHAIKSGHSVVYAIEDGKGIKVPTRTFANDIFGENDEPPF